MFERTRRKIVASIMSILVFIFIGILAVIFGSSYYETTVENRRMLQRHAELYSLGNIVGEGFQADKLKDDISDLIKREPKPNGSGGARFEDTPEYQLSAFYSVAISDDGEIIGTDNQRGVYTDNELNEMALEVCGEDDSWGRIGKLMYCKADKGGYTLVAFMDNSIMQNGVTTLFKYTLICGSIAIVLFFFLAKRLAKMIVRPLEESYTKQKQFISDAGHELKTPVSVVSANAELLSRELGENRWLSNIQYENERMGALVTQLLDLARTENVTPQTEELDLSRLVSGEVLPFESVIFEKGMTLSCSIQENLKVLGNSAQLKQLTSIFLDNAVKHALAKSEIVLRLKQERGHAVLSVINDGEEIPPEQRKKIFERFYRVDPARNSEGTHYGLGLAIAKAITVSHHGKIDVSCGEGKVRFCVSIPLRK